LVVSSLTYQILLSLLMTNFLGLYNIGPYRSFEALPFLFYVYLSCLILTVLGAFCLVVQPLVCNLHLLILKKKKKKKKKKKD
jgi:hypothetical protein